MDDFIDKWICSILSVALILVGIGGLLFTYFYPHPVVEVRGLFYTLFVGVTYAGFGLLRDSPR